MKLEDMNDQQLARAIRMKKIQVIADIFLVIFIIGIGFYIFKNIAYIKAAEQMSISYCQAYLEKVGMQCFNPNWMLP